MPLFNWLEDNYLVVGSTSAPTTTSATFVVIPQMTITFAPQGTNQKILFTGDFNIQSGDAWDLALFLDAVEIANTRRHMEAQGSSFSLPGSAVSTAHSFTSLAAGSHTIDVRWAVSGGTARAVLTQRELLIKDAF